MTPILSVDWSAVIDQLIERGLTHPEIGRAMSSVLTTRMVACYKQGVQPSHWRGEALIKFWALKTGKARESLPMCEAKKHKSRQHYVEPKVVQTAHLAAFLTPAKTEQKRRGRKPKLTEAVV